MPAPIPRSTYRLQLNADFGFRQAHAIVAYLDALGISHLYLSPYLRARAGSSHGYDIIDHNRLNPELGDPEDLAALSRELAARGMGQVLDFVPNHMGIGMADNEWWLDVLEWGQASPFARYFDIDWRPAKRELRGKVLLPFLGDHYGQVLENGELKLAFDPQSGRFDVWYYEHRFPLAARSYGFLLWAFQRHGLPPPPAEAEVRELIQLFRAVRPTAVSPPRARRLREQAAAGRERLATLARTGGAEEWLQAGIDDVNGTPGRPESFVGLHRLLQAQFYRVAYWRVAADEINYRRFFDINDLAGLRIERSELFDVAHRLVREQIAAGTLHGLRIDHIDGLFDPKNYCEKLQRLAQGARPAVEGAGDPPPAFYILVEKILAPHERLRADWPVAGTTGYEFINQVNGLFLDPTGERDLTRGYARFTRQPTDFNDVLYESKKHIMTSALASELNVLANELSGIAEANWHTRDFTRVGLYDALKEVVACFPVYRTYVGERGASTEDRRDIEWAISQARRRMLLADDSIFAFLQDILTTDAVRRRGSGFSRARVIRFAMKFQQYTGPVMAKGMEDTSFYRDARLLSLNEVGGDPRRYAVSVAAFHHRNAERLRYWPHNLLTTATHDTKRGEDVRARLNVLSEMPREWGRRARRWSVLNRRHRTVGEDVTAPTGLEEYIIYQTLLGAWPMALTGTQTSDRAESAAFRDRVCAYMTKAMREAKLTTSWRRPRPEHEEAVHRFVEAILEPETPNPFLTDFTAFQAVVGLAGARNGLAQQLLKLTVPGVPDLYQGSELWDLSLVDPDNRRPVDYEHRRAILQQFSEACPDDLAAPPALLNELCRDWPDGRIKFYLTWHLMRLRQRTGDLLQEGSYLPIPVAGTQADRACAFARRRGEAVMVVVVPRLLAAAGAPADLLCPGADFWQDTRLDLAELLPLTALRDSFSGRPTRLEEADGGPCLSLASLLSDFPVGLLLGGGRP